MKSHSCSYELENWRCTSCQQEPPKLKQRYSLAPELALQNNGFHPDSFKKLYELEAGNFWFRARSKLIVWALEKFFPDKTSFFEIGCGTGYVLSSVHKSRPKLTLYGSDIYSSSLDYAAERVPLAQLFQMDATCIPLKNQFDVIGAFDVIEHIEEDELALAQIFSALRPGGGLLITVPQHPFLWSPVDEIACHKRRYRSHELIHKVVAAGFQVVLCRSFISFLLPLMMLSRYRLRKKSQRGEVVDSRQEFNSSQVLNRALEIILAFERVMLKCHCSLPFGGSLLLVARKPEILPE